MKPLKLFLICSLLATLSFLSCQKETEEKETPCEFLATIEPICSFNPKTNTKVSFPVKVTVDGVNAGHDLYQFSWSKDAAFKGSAISVTYEQLPLILTLTEIETGCVAISTLSQDYW